MAKRRRTDNTMAKRRRTNNTMAKRRRPDNTMAKRKRTNNDVQNNTQTTIDQATRTPLKTGVNSGVPKGLAVPPPLETPQKDNQSQVQEHIPLFILIILHDIYIYVPK